MKFRRPAEDDYSLNLAPLIDVVFLLLIFFMVSTAFVDFTRRMDIELPESQSGRAMEKAIVYSVEIAPDRKIYLNGEEVSLGQLESRVKNPADKAAKRSAVIRAHKELPYGYIVKVMGICQAANISDIGIAVE